MGNSRSSQSGGSALPSVRAGSAPPRKRHPLCPYCHYDLVATVDRFRPRVIRCPECGESIEPNELTYSRRPGEWSTAKGLRNAVLSLLLRVVIVAIIWCAMLALMDSGLRGILGASGVLYLRVMLIPLTICGLFIGWMMFWKMYEHAGFESWLITWLAVGAAWFGLHAGHALANAVFNLTYLSAGGWSMMVGMVVAVVIVYRSFHEME